MAGYTFAENVFLPVFLCQAHGESGKPEELALEFSAVCHDAAVSGVDICPVAVFRLNAAHRGRTEESDAVGAVAGKDLKAGGLLIGSDVSPGEPYVHSALFLFFCPASGDFREVRFLKFPFQGRDKGESGILPV